MCPQSRAMPSEQRRGTRVSPNRASRVSQIGLWIRRATIPPTVRSKRRSRSTYQPRTRTRTRFATAFPSLQVTTSYTFYPYDDKDSGYDQPWSPGWSRKRAKQTVHSQCALEVTTDRADEVLGGADLNRPSAGFGHHGGSVVLGLLSEPTRMLALPIASATDPDRGNQYFMRRTRSTASYAECPATG